MENALFRLSNDIRAHKLNLAALQESTLRRNFNAFSQALSNETPQTIEWFFDEFYDEIMFVFKESHAFWQQLGTQSPTLRSAIDQARQRLPRQNRFTMGITHIFGLFIQGISYFSNEMDANALPVYHRLVSCGPATDAFRQTYLKCKINDMTPQERAMNKQRIYTCYLERLIYDKMYQEWALAFPAKLSDGDQAFQDQGHLHWLDVTQKDYNSCFPHSKLYVDITFENKWPTILKVTHCIKNKTLSQETYTRRLSGLRNMLHYNPVVVGVKETNSYHYIKTQTFHNKAEWQRIRAANAPMGPCHLQSSVPDANTI